MKTKLLLLVALTASLAACQKTAKNNNIKPSIYFEGMTPNAVTDASPKDTVFITFKVSDGDGDLGNDPTSGNHDVYLIDSRIDQVNPYYFPTIPTDAIDPNKGVSAHCTIKVVAALFLAKRPERPNGDTLKYRIYVKDKAGHISDTITTPPIYIYP